MTYDDVGTGAGPEAPENTTPENMGGTEPETPETVDETGTGTTGDGDTSGSSDSDQESYDSPLAGAIAALGNAFSDNLPEGIGNLAKQLFKMIAEKLEDSYQAAEDFQAQEDYLITGQNIPNVTREVADVMGANPVDFQKELSDTAAVMRGEMSPEEAGINRITEINDAISTSAQAYPAATGKSLQAFSVMGESWLQSKEMQDAFESGMMSREQAEQDLATVNQTMAESYYESVRQAEQNGLQITEADREVLNNLNMYGVTQTYDEYVAMKEAELEDPTATPVSTTPEEPPVASRSDGTLQESTDHDFSAAETSATAAVLNGEFVDTKRDTEVIEACQQDSADYINAVRGADDPPNPQAMGDRYMTRMAELQAYNDYAISAIENKYADDPEAKAMATAGLALRMEASMGPMFDAMKEDQEAYGCFTPEQLEQLDNMNVTGVTTSYSEYIPGTTMFPPQIEPGEDDALYADALEQAPASNTAATPLAQGSLGQEGPAPEAPAQTRQVAATQPQTPKPNYYEMAATRLNIAGITNNREQEETGPSYGRV